MTPDQSPGQAWGSAKIVLEKWEVLSGNGLDAEGLGRFVEAFEKEKKRLEGGDEG